MKTQRLVADGWEDMVYTQHIFFYLVSDTQKPSM
jgi:hypothetical protein